VAGVPSAEWGQAIAAFVALAGSGDTGGDTVAGTGGAGTGTTGTVAGTGAHAVVQEQQWHQRLGLLAPKTVLTAPELLMLPNGKPDRLAMIERLNALHGGK
jgi:O-succinylbenzoic acid--CoA ligase